ncbi:FecR domain-containing protein [Chitinophaga horti]|uniref:FecR domain-containing protein n=1 Tax=Chitinophaga horti TaxID=2920382 RepID=A0ABY6IVI9_9BACT|nr:FecR family protein [Chitinophaga horti]UYQ91392.1 FecR domain-containing protein [Chitinophaga horti]
MTPTARIRYLVTQFVSGTCTPQERHELFGYINRSENDEALKSALDEAWAAYEPNTPMPDDVSERILSNIYPTSQPMVVKHRRNLGWAAAAALVLSAGAFFIWKPAPQPRMLATPTPRYQNEVQPGGNKALLTLADGTVIELDSAANGVLATQNGAQVKKLANGQLVYDATAANGAPSGNNTMSTPRGGSYRLSLPDGTQVWLNASSSITYPVNFAANERRVTISGEVYFEVTPDAARPFRVNAPQMEVQVLGTSFNINAYEDESAVRTTLLTGAVKITAGAQVSSVLQPGQQASLKQQSLTVANNINTEDVIAWKNGYFQFNDADMATVMRQLEKWYDVEVVYEGEVPKRSFGGGMQRSLPLTQVLKILEENDVQFKVTGNRITVMK